MQHLSEECLRDVFFLLLTPDILKIMSFTKIMSLQNSLGLEVLELGSHTLQISSYYLVTLSVLSLLINKLSLP